MQTLISLRVAAKDLERLEALLPFLSQHDDLRAVRVTRSLALRVALQRGLDSLERAQELEERIAARRRKEAAKAKRR